MNGNIENISNNNLTMPQIGFGELPSPEQVHHLTQHEHQHNRPHIQPTPDIQHCPTYAHMYLITTNTVPQGRTITSQHWRSSRMKDIVAMNRPRMLQILFFTLLRIQAGILAVDELVDLLLVGVVGVALHAEGLDVGDADQADVPHHNQAQDGLAGFGGAAAGQLLLGGQCDEGEQVHNDGHPYHVQFELYVEYPSAVECPT